MDERCLECSLSAAALDEDLAAVESALAEGADPGAESDCNTALFHAIETGSPEIVEALLEAGADLSRRHPITGETPLTAALEARQPDAFRALVRGGADPRTVSLAPLVRGCDDPEVVRLAGAVGVDVNGSDGETGRTALHEAAIYGYLETVRCLLASGADKTAQDRWGQTAATLSRRNGHAEVARALEP